MAGQWGPGVGASFPLSLLGGAPSFSPLHPIILTLPAATHAPGNAAIHQLLPTATSTEPPNWPVILLFQNIPCSFCLHSAYLASLGHLRPHLSGALHPAPSPSGLWVSEPTVVS